jgi:hypothetical protein
VTSDHSITGTGAGSYSLELALRPVTRRHIQHASEAITDYYRPLRPISAQSATMDAAWDRLYPWTGLSEYVAVPRQGRICPLSAWAVDFLRASDAPCRTAGSAEATERFVGRRRRPEARYLIGMLGRLASTAFEPVRSTTGMPEGELVGRRSSCQSRER